MPDVRGGDAAGAVAARGEVSPGAVPLAQVAEEGEEGLGGRDEEWGKDDGDDLVDFQTDTQSVLSDDSFYPPDESRGDGPEVGGSPAPPLSLYQACVANNALMLKARLQQGLSEREVMETDRNNRTGLLVACYQGFMDIVFTLAQCPYVDVNWQDKEGNTALIIAAQAGHLTITNYLLNYFPGLDIEKRNVHGFTSLMKAAIQGRTECVRALLLAGADINATDPGRQFTPLQWTVFTARHDTTYLIHKLLARPCPEQFSDKYRPEWPKLKELVAKAKEPRTCLEKICETIRSTLTFNFPHDPEEEGLMDHMVRMTTSISSPFVTIGCRTVCPDSPPCVGKRRLAVQEILCQQKAEDNKPQGKELLIKELKHQNQFQNTVLVTQNKDRRASLQPVTLAPGQTIMATTRRSSLMTLSMLRRSSVRPGSVMPKVHVSKAPTPTYQPEQIRRRSSAMESHLLDVPKWKYKELKEERKKAEEAEKQREVN